jgi:hypothetical protein
MALFGFRTRNLQRDHETDIGRLQRLHQLFGEIRAEIEQEKSGLRDRYEKVMADAAFSQQTLEDGRAGVAISSKIDDLTETMIRYSKRIASLDTQINFVAEMDRRLDLFPQENVEEKASA